MEIIRMLASKVIQTPIIQICNQNLYIVTTFVVVQYQKIK